MNSEIKIICAWCGVVLIDGPVDADGNASHGICGECKFKQMQIYRFRKVMGFETVKDLSDKAIWKVYEHSYMMAKIRLDIRFSELKKEIIKSFQNIYQYCKNIREMNNAKKP